MGFHGVGPHYKYHSILPELKIQLAGNLVVNITTTIIPSDKPYFIINYNVLRGSRSKLQTMSNSDLWCIVAIDDKAGNIGIIHYLNKIKSTQLQVSQINAAKNSQESIQQLFRQWSENEKATIVG